MDKTYFCQVNRLDFGFFTGPNVDLDFVDQSWIPLVLHRCCTGDWINLQSCWIRVLTGL